MVKVQYEFVYKPIFLLLCIQTQINLLIFIGLIILQVSIILLNF